VWLPALMTIVFGSFSASFAAPAPTEPGEAARVDLVAEDVSHTRMDPRKLRLVLRRRDECLLVGASLLDQPQLFFHASSENPRSIRFTVTKTLDIVDRSGVRPWRWVRSSAHCVSREPDVDRDVPFGSDSGAALATVVGVPRHFR